MLDSLVRVSRRVGWVADIAADPWRPGVNTPRPATRRGRAALRTVARGVRSYLFWRINRITTRDAMYYVSASCGFPPTAVRHGNNCSVTHDVVTVTLPTVPAACDPLR